MELNKSYLGDCLEIMPLIPDKSIDMVLCDLPYATTSFKWDVIIPFADLWKQYARVIKDKGAIVLTAYQPFSSMLVSSNYGYFKYSMVWDKVSKGDIMNAKNKPLRQHEDILVFSKGTVANGSKKRMNYYPQGVKDGIRTNNKNIQGESATKNGRPCMKQVYKCSGSNYPTTIIKFSNADRTNAVHPTQKPIALFEYLIKTYTNEGETVLDNCAGSFTAAIACLNTNRKYICIEKDETYFSVGMKRIEQWKPEYIEPRLF